MSEKKYLVAQASAPAFLTAVGNIQGAVGSTVASSLGSEKAVKFSAEVTALVKNKEFLSELGDIVGEPAELETEEQFVARAKEAMRSLLKSRLK